MKHSSLFESSWPRTSEDLWKWEPIQNFFTDLSEQDLKLLESPFVDGQNVACNLEKEPIRVLPDGTEPLAVHYALSWLKEDAQDMCGTRREPYDVNKAILNETSLLQNHRYCFNTVQLYARQQHCDQCPENQEQSRHGSREDNTSSIRSLSLQSRLENDSWAKEGKREKLPRRNYWFLLLIDCSFFHRQEHLSRRKTLGEWQ